MRHFPPCISFILLLFCPLVVTADTKILQQWRANPTAIFAAKDVKIDAFMWQARPLIVFADSPLDPAFIAQIDLLKADIKDVQERDIVIITDTDVTTPSALRRQLRPRGFTLVLIGKDGGVKLRKPFPWDMRELSRVIDKMPMRRREIKERKKQ